MCPHPSFNVSLFTWTGKDRTVIYVIHACMQSGTYRFANPEKLFEDVLEILRTNPAASEWMTDKGSNEVDDTPEYKKFQDAIEKGCREVAKSGSRLFKKGSMDSKSNWRKGESVSFSLMFMCPYTHPNVFMFVCVVPSRQMEEAQVCVVHLPVLPQVSKLSVLLQLFF